MPTSSSLPLRITVLGSGTSTGVPTIGCLCSVCQSSNPYNKRTRSSLLLTRLDTAQNIVIDTTPDFRQHMLTHKVRDLSHVLYTHTHADHCHGFDDLRAFYFFSRKPVDCYLGAEHQAEFQQRFRYAFVPTSYEGTVPQVNLVTIPEQRFNVAGLDVEPVRLPHGSMTTIGFRFGSFAYLTDFKAFPAELVPAWRGKVHTMIASGVRFKAHSTHSTIPETLQLFTQLEVKKGIITHLSHDVDHERDSSALPSHCSFAYDGLTLELST